MTPLVSVMMPCYNSAQTLPLALASLIAQTYGNWECVLVDDGSTDRPIDIVEQANDKRIKYLRLEKNIGRGVARQVALDHAAGEYLCMLDADDWIYPSKIQRQIEMMVSEPKLALVSTGMAIVNTQNEIVGVRSRGPQGTEPVLCGPLTTLARPPAAHAPSMIRMQIAKQVKYDPSFVLAEDADFLLRILMDRYYCLLPDVTYAYSEYATITLEKIVRAVGYNRQMFWKHRGRFPMASRINICKSAAKSIIYRGAFAVGLGKWMIRRRSQRPTAEDIYNFNLARQPVLAMANHLFQQPDFCAGTMAGGFA